MSANPQEEDRVVDFSGQEWNRLSTLSEKFETRFKKTFLGVITQGRRTSLIGNAVKEAVIETAITTSQVYGIPYDPTAERYRRLTASLTDQYLKVFDSDDAKNSVRSILPKGLTFSDRISRLDVFGLSTRDALRLEHMRQHGSSKQDIATARFNMSVQRSNIVALTEANRIINGTIEALWQDNTTISKARRKFSYDGVWYYQNASSATTITSLRGIPHTASKVIVTRRDNRTCEYCLPLEGLTAKLDQPFKTKYGVFRYPPFHPRCRCYMVVTA